jgi:phosphatidylglycerophosphate synthase
MLDPIADKAMVVIALLVHHRLFGMDPWLILPATVILFREVFVSAACASSGRHGGAAEGHEAGQVEDHGADGRHRGAVRPGGSNTCDGQAMALARIAEAEMGEAGTNTGCIAAYGWMNATWGGLMLLIWVAAALTLITGWDYFSQGAALSEGRAMIDVLYFAWVRERIGLPRERRSRPRRDRGRPGGRTARARGALCALPSPTFQPAGGAGPGTDRFRRAAEGRARGGVLSADDRGLSDARPRAGGAVRPRRRARGLRARAGGHRRRRHLHRRRARRPGGGLARMEIEHYPGMTERAIGRSSAEASQPLGAVGCSGHPPPRPDGAGRGDHDGRHRRAHRQEAFEAAEFLMDYLKSRAPFWKKELTADGAAGSQGRRTSRRGALPAAGRR